MFWQILILLLYPKQNTTCGLILRDDNGKPYAMREVIGPYFYNMNVYVPTPAGNWKTHPYMDMRGYNSKHILNQLPTGTTLYFLGLGFNNIFFENTSSAITILNEKDLETVSSPEFSGLAIVSATYVVAVPEKIEIIGVVE
jgi:hypothetical protein